MTIEINEKAKKPDPYGPFLSKEEFRAAIKAGKAVGLFRMHGENAGTLYDWYDPSYQVTEERLTNYLNKFHLRAHNTWQVVVYKGVRVKSVVGGSTGYRVLCQRSREALDFNIEQLNKWEILLDAFPTKSVKWQLLEEPVDIVG